MDKKNILTFDRLMLKIPNKYVNIIEESELAFDLKDGVVNKANFEQHAPFFYKINQNYRNGETTVEFSGKSLMEDYPSLISHTNIHKCFENINNQGICFITPQQAIDSALVQQCDVTCDISSQYTVKELYARLIFSSNKKWSIQSVTSNRFSIESTQTTNWLKTRFIVYDKETEMNAKRNIPFLSAVSNKDTQLEYFKDKIRFELNLRSVDRIRHHFNIYKDKKQGYPKLTEIIYSTEDPIGKFLSDALIHYDVLNQAQDTAKTKNLSELEHLLLLAICGYDLDKVERVIRDLYGSSRSIKRAIAPYVSVMNQLKMNCPNPESDQAFDEIRTRLQYMLNMAFDSHGQSPTDLTSLYHSRKTDQNDSWKKSINDDRHRLYDVRNIILPGSSNPISA